MLACLIGCEFVFGFAVYLLWLFVLRAYDLRVLPAFGFYGFVLLGFGSFGCWRVFDVVCGEFGAWLRCGC